MGRIKLQMQISLDGFAGAGDKDAGFNWGEEAHRFSIGNLRDVDTVLFGRKTAEGFIPHWGKVATDPVHRDFAFAKTVMAIPRVVFSNTIKSDKWQNTSTIGGDFVMEIEALKKKSGNDIMVYGGISFVSSLIEHRLIDEFFFLVNPVALGHGEAIFHSLRQRMALELKECKPFESGTVMLHYRLS